MDITSGIHSFNEKVTDFTAKHPTLVGAMIVAGVIAVVALTVFGGIPELMVIGALLAAMGLYALIVSVKYLQDRIDNAPQVRDENIELQKNAVQQTQQVQNLTSQIKILNQQIAVQDGLRKEITEQRRTVQNLQTLLEQSTREVKEQANKISNLNRRVIQKDQDMRQMVQAGGPDNVANELFEGNLLLQEQLERQKLLSEQDAAYNISLGTDRARNQYLLVIEKLEKTVQELMENNKDIENEELLLRIEELEAKIVELDRPNQQKKGREALLNNLGKVEEEPPQVVISNTQVPVPAKTNAQEIAEEKRQQMLNARLRQFELTNNTSENK
jgi:hypothetical protein